MFLHAKNAFGLDIGDRSLKLVWLDRHRSLHSYNETAVPAGVIENGVIKDKTALADAIMKLLSTMKGSKIKTVQVVACLPETKSFLDVVTVPGHIKKRQMEQYILKQIPNSLPFTPEEVYIDGQVLSKSYQSSEVLVGVAPREIVDDYMDVLSQAGLEVQALQSEAAAFVNALIKEVPSRRRSSNTIEVSTLAIVDIGVARSSLIVYDKGTIQFSKGLPFSSEEITEEIAIRQDVSIEEAEKRKRACGLSRKACPEVYKYIEPAFAELAKDISKALEFYQKTTQREVTFLLLSGGALIKGLEEYLQSKIGLPTKVGDPFVNLKPTKRLRKKIKNPPSFTTAIGLALSGI
ncbi:type IV pilus assembly protein PilM [Patescibacteria group bacterium]|nr:type IV pilus assembly protein PilM [Patescibacteria group bacterium]